MLLFLIYVAFSYIWVSETRSLPEGQFRDFDRKMALLFLFVSFLFAGLCCTAARYVVLSMMPGTWYLAQFPSWVLHTTAVQQTVNNTWCKFCNRKNGKAKMFSTIKNVGGLPTAVELTRACMLPPMDVPGSGCRFELIFHVCMYVRTHGCSRCCLK